MFSQKLANLSVNQKTKRTFLGLKLLTAVAIATGIYLRFLGVIYY